MSESQLLKRLVELMATADVAYMTAIGADGYPRTRAMLNLRNRAQYPDQVGLYSDHDRDLMVYLGTNTSSAKTKELEKNPRICVYFCQEDKFFGVSLVGDAELVEDMAVKEALWVDWWSRYYPTGKPTAPDFTVYRLRPIEARGWRDAKTFALDLPA